MSEFNPRRGNKARYRGKFTPQQLIFNDNLQEFSYQVSIICGLETNGKLTPEEAYKRIKKLWKQVKNSKKNLIKD